MSFVYDDRDIAFHICTFSLIALSKANEEYSTKLDSGQYNEKTMFALSWQIKELEDLNAQGRKLIVSASVLIEKCEDSLCDYVAENISRQLQLFRDSLYLFVKNVTQHRRHPATHIFVFMISPEERRMKPYAIQVQCIPCAGLSDAKVRELLNKLIEQMTEE